MNKIFFGLASIAFWLFSTNGIAEPSSILYLSCSGVLKKEVRENINGRREVRRESTDVVTDLAIDFSKRKLLVQYGPMKVCNEECDCGFDQLGYTCKSKFKSGGLLGSGLGHSVVDETTLSIGISSGIATFSRIFSTSTNASNINESQVTASDGRLMCIPIPSGSRRPPS